VSLYKRPFFLENLVSYSCKQKSVRNGQEQDGGISMKKNLTELVFILDCSGSMAPLQMDTIGGFQSLLQEQKQKEGEAFVSTVLFSDKSRVLHDRKKIAEVAPLTTSDYVPYGCTALLDAVGGAVKHISHIHKYAREEDRPEKTLFVIITDGMENASRFYRANEVKRMIQEKKQKEHWEFLFIGANIDAVEVASELGIEKEYAADYCADEMGTDVLYHSVNQAVTYARSAPACASMPTSWKDQIQKDFRKRGRKK